MFLFLEGPKKQLKFKILRKYILYKLYVLKQSPSGLNLKKKSVQFVIVQFC